MDGVFERLPDAPQTRLPRPAARPPSESDGPAHGTEAAPKQIPSKADYQEERGWTTFARGGAAVEPD